MATLDEAVEEYEALRSRYRGAPWLRGMGVAHLGDYGYGLELRGPEHIQFPDVFQRIPARRLMDGAFTPLHVARWRWSGRPELFDLCDLDGNGVVDEHEIDACLGQAGVQMAHGDTASPIDEGSWDGDADVFAALDQDGDGRIAREELEEGLGPHAMRLARGEPGHGPPLPRGAAYGWRGNARTVIFPNREAKATYMADAAKHDAEDPQVQEWSRQFSRLPLAQRAPAILRFCQLGIRYERDPGTHDAAGVRHGIELLDSSATGLFRGYGDCDLKARLFVALCLASGVAAKIDPVFEGANGFPHVRAKVLRGDDTGGGGWDVADPTIVNSEIGRLPRKPKVAFPRAFAATARL